MNLSRSILFKRLKIEVGQRIDLLISLLFFSSYHEAFSFPLECTSETWFVRFSMANELLFFILLGKSLLEFPLNERFFLIRFRFIIIMVFFGGTFTALSTQSPAWAQPHGLVDGPSSQSGFSLETTLYDLSCSPSCLVQIGHNGSLWWAFGVDWSRHSAWKTCWHGSTPVTGMSRFLMMDRNPQGDFCERYLLHNPHLNELEATCCALVELLFQSRTGSGTSTESMLLVVPLLQLQASAESDVVSLALSEGCRIGWTGLDRKKRRFEKFRLGSESPMSEQDENEHPVPTFLDVPGGWLRIWSAERVEKHFTHWSKQETEHNRRC